MLRGNIFWLSKIHGRASMHIPRASILMRFESHIDSWNLFSLNCLESHHSRADWSLRRAIACSNSCPPVAFSEMDRRRSGDFFFLSNSIFDHEFIDICQHISIPFPTTLIAVFGAPTTWQGNRTSLWRLFFVITFQLLIKHSFQSDIWACFFEKSFQTHFMLSFICLLQCVSGAVF